MTFTLTNAIIRIIDAAGETTGTGFIAAGNLAVTCAHVVEFASGGPGQTVRFVFHAAGEEANAVVEPDGWRDPAAEDIAILRLAEPLPAGVEPLPLGPAKGSKGPFRSFGFPEIGDKDETHVDGHINGLIKEGRWLQISAEQISPGVSGGPVFETQTGRVVGVISEFPKWKDRQTGREQAGDSFGRQANTNYATPTERLLKIWPALKSSLLPPAIHSYPRVGRRDYYHFAELPEIYIPRSELITEVREILLAPNPHTLAPAVALHGMGGAGKSVMARALCNDAAVRARFADGILWATLGQKPDIKAILSGWIDALGGTITQNAPTVEQLQTNLDQLLQDRACLLIADDVWNTKDAKSLRLGGPACCLLLTIRNRIAAEELGAMIQLIPQMTISEAVDLLERWSKGRLKRVASPLKTKIVKRLGRLPLAVKLAGAQLARPEFKPDQWLY